MSFKVTVVTVTRNKVAIVIFKFTVWIYKATVTRNKVTIMSFKVIFGRYKLSYMKVAVMRFKVTVRK